MVKYKTEITPNSQDEFLNIILDSANNTKKRKKIQILYLTFGFFSFIIGFPSLVGKLKINGIILVSFAFLLFIISKKIKDIQRHLLKKKERKIFNKLHCEKIVIEYQINENGIITITGDKQYKNSWSEFKNYGENEKIIYIERDDGKLIVIEKEKIDDDEIKELKKTLQNIG